MAQPENRRQGNGVVTARHRDPRVVVRGKRALHPAVEFEVVALLADCGALGLVTGQAEIVHIDGGGFQFVLEGHFVLFGIDFVDGYLCERGVAGQKGGNEPEKQVKIFHSEAIIIYKILNFVLS